jgi:hypothetical protein
MASDRGTVTRSLLLVSGLLLAGCGGDGDLGRPDPSYTARRAAVADAGGRKPAPATPPNLTVPQFKPEVLTPLAELTQYDSGPGLVVCPPAPVQADAATANFGAGCGLWLQAVVGGHGELGKTPPFRSVRSAIWQWRRRNLQATAANAAQIARWFGVDHLLVGEVTGGAPACALTYRLLKLPGAQPVGAELRLTGTKEEVLRQLPQAALDLCGRFHLNSAVSGAGIGTPQDLTTAGEFVPIPDETLTEGQGERLFAIAPRSLTAAMVSAGMPDVRTPAAPHPERAQELLGLSSTESVLALDELSWSIMRGSEMPPAPFYETAGRVWQRFPHNLVLNDSQAALFLHHAQREEAVRSAEAAVRCSTQSPQAWSLLASVLASFAHDVLGRRTPASLGVGERATLQPLFDRWVESSRRAAELNPASPLGWTRLAENAQATGDMKTAAEAIEKGRAADPGEPDVYRQALELHGPNGLKDKAKRDRFAREAGTRPWPRLEDRHAIFHILEEAGYESLAAPLERSLKAAGVKL